MLRWAWRHRRGIVGTTLAAGATYGAYVAYRKKKELEELLDSLGLQQFLSGGSGAANGAKTKEAR